GEGAGWPASRREDADDETGRVERHRSAAVQHGAAGFLRGRRVAPDHDGNLWSRRVSGRLAESRDWYPNGPGRAPRRCPAAGPPTRNEARRFGQPGWTGGKFGGIAPRRQPTLQNLTV